MPLKTEDLQSKQSLNKDSLSRAAEENKQHIIDAIMGVFSTKSPTVVMKKDEFAELIAYAYQKGANAVIECIE